MCSKTKWKREKVQDHKFDFIDTRDFTDNSCGMRMKYMWLYIIVLKDFLVYISDIFTAITMLSSETWSNAIFDSCPVDSHNGCVAIPFSIGKWLFFGCICFSFLLLAYDAYKAKKIIASRDISYAFTNVMANHYYSLRSYDHFCFFDHISNSTKRIDDFAFFVFFTFKSWKRLLLADGPRQSINALTLYAFYLSKKDAGPWWDLSKYFDGSALVTKALTVSTLFTVLVFGGSLLLLIVAGICYIPLLCHIQGNLKEYCCHKVDKRIDECIKRKKKERLAKHAALAKKEAAGDYSHLKNKKGEIVGKPLPQPTLPTISLDDDEVSSVRTGVPPSTYTQSDYYYSDHKSTYDVNYPHGQFPPMPAFAQPYGHYSHGSEPHVNPSMGTLADDKGYDDDDYGSTAHLALSAAPFADRGNTSSPAPQHQQVYGHPDPLAHGQGYQNQYMHANDPLAYRGPSPAPSYHGASDGGLAYNNGRSHQQDYSQYLQAAGQHNLSHAQQYQYQQAYPTDRKSGGSDGCEYGAGPAHAL